MNPSEADSYDEALGALESQAERFEGIRFAANKKVGSRPLVHSTRFQPRMDYSARMGTLQGAHAEGAPATD